MPCPRNAWPRTSQHLLLPLLLPRMDTCRFAHSLIAEPLNLFSFCFQLYCPFVFLSHGMKPYPCSHITMQLFTFGENHKIPWVSPSLACLCCCNSISWARWPPQDIISHGYRSCKLKHQHSWLPAEGSPPGLQQRLPFPRILTWQRRCSGVSSLSHKSHNPDIGALLNLSISWTPISKYYHSEGKASTCGVCSVLSRSFPIPDVHPLQGHRCWTAIQLFIPVITLSYI